jgi:adenosine deaminase
MPKAELHLHLDGSLRPETALELLRAAREAGLDLPADVDGPPDPHAADALDAIRTRLVAPDRGLDQASLLRAFDLPVALLQDAGSLERCARELVEDVAAEGTRYVEIRWAPSLHLTRGLGLREGMAAVVRGAREAAVAAGISARLIAVALRTQPPSMAVDVAHAAVGFVAAGLTGFDLAGVERQAPDPRPFAEAFGAARDGGLAITCHAGEWGGASQVRAALTVTPARIAHGAPAADDPTLMAELIARDVTLDLCPSSNLQAGIGSADADAPLPRLLRGGVAVTISTDDRTVGDLTLVEELERCVLRLGLTPAEIAGAVRRAYAAAFLQHDEGERADLRQTFETWLVEHPAPA